MADTSAAYIIAILAVTMGLIGTLVLTVTDPVMQAAFNSTLFTATNTTTGSDALTWQQQAWTYYPAFILLSIMVTVWIGTRRPT